MDGAGERPAETAAGEDEAATPRGGVADGGGAEGAAGGGVAAGGGAEGAAGGGVAADRGGAADGGGAPVGGAARRRGGWRRLPVGVRVGAGAAVVAGLGVAGVVLLGGGDAVPLPGVQAPPVSRGDPVPYDGRSPLLVAETEQRVLVELLRPALGRQRNARALGADAQRRYIASLKREQTTLRSGLRARGVVLRDVVSFYRVWNGFAATVKTSDIARLTYPGSRVRTVRRAYSATGEPAPVPGAPPLDTAPTTANAPVALLDTGVDAKALGDRAAGGYDAVDRDTNPRPGSSGDRRETSGTALAQVLAAEGERVLPIRVASLRAAGGIVQAEATTDQLIAGLERAVDPNGDGDASDHVAVALVGVNAPYAGFGNSPEAQAVSGAAGLGTLTVAPAGDEGAAAPGSGTIGSPAAAPDALAVGALTGSEPAPTSTLTVDGTAVTRAAVLAGDPPDAGQAAGPVEASDPARLGDVQTRLRDKVVIVRAGANPAAQAAAAAAVGARAVVLASTEDRSLPAIAAGRAAVPVVGVTGEAASRLLSTKPGTEIRFGATERGQATDAGAAVAPSTSQGPSAGGLPKPDLAAPGSALTPAGVVGGGAVAAARVAVVAAQLARKRPDLSPRQLRATLIAGADPGDLPVDRAGAGAVRTPQDAPGITADPPTAFSGPLDPVAVELETTTTTDVTFRATGGATAQPAQATLRPGAPTRVSVRLAQAGTAFGRLETLQAGKVVASTPWLVRPDTVTPISVGELKVGGGRRVRFTLGAFKRGERTEVQVAERLVLDLVDAQGRVLRSLTASGGARELMPAEYAYTIPRDQLPSTSYAFRVRAWAPRQEDPTVQRSALVKR